MHTRNTSQWIIDDLIKKWEGNKRYTLSVLEAMPEEHYDFKPSPEMMSFRQQALHIADGFGYHLKAGGLSSTPKLQAHDKAGLIDAYSEIFEEILTVFASIDETILAEEHALWYGQSTKNRILNLMDNHLAHHRGQMTVYLRLKGIKPPTYVGW